jgi:hypothetical protein
MVNIVNPFLFILALCLKAPNVPTERKHANIIFLPMKRSDGTAFALASSNPK